MTAPRPICVHCGKPYGKRDTKMEYVVWPDGEVMPPYRGNGIVVSTSMHHTAPHDCSGTVYGVSFTNNDNVALRDIWNGETWWGGHKPFCTLRCALDFARKAFLAGYRPQQLEKTK
jgi:hypothetical protein